MLKWIFRKLFIWQGWTIDADSLPEEMNRCVLVAAPHTSNWDGVFVFAACDVASIPLKLGIKAEHNRFPYGKMMEKMGALWIDRRPMGERKKKINYVDAMVELFKTDEPIAVGLAPEGTRSLRKRWKMGFYHIAVKANVPICLSFLDFGTKTAGIDKVIYPSGDMEKDLREIMAYYAKFTPKYPE
ncbi:MAG: 1-acyl-sn-glycerol-3-phosphate acyltransferase, partial [Chitinophagales bacterium]